MNKQLNFTFISVLKLLAASSLILCLFFQIVLIAYYF